MNAYKDFLHRLRKKEFDDVYILVTEDVSQKLKQYVQLLLNVKFEDGRFYALYGEVKKIIASFIIYYTSTIDEVVKIADAYTNVIEKDDLIRLVERTISIHQENQVEFGNKFLPVETPYEKQIYEELDKAYVAYTKKLFDLKSVIYKLEKRSQVADFAKEQFPVSVRKTNEIIEMVHVYLGMMLADNMRQIRSSLEEILLRLVNNLKKVQEDSNKTVNSLLHQLYERNKECIMINRRTANNSIAIAEVTHGIDGIRTKIANSQPDIPIDRLETEIAYWKARIEYFSEIFENLTKLKSEQEALIRSEKAYNDLKCNELPGSKTKCWQEMGVNIAQRKEELKQMIINESKALITFFALRGNDRIIYTDSIGMYYLDEFDHKVYIFDSSLKIFHVNCEGEFLDFPDNEYYYDQNGRYIKRDDEKVYQSGPCTSHYKLGDGNLLTKVTVDCGHSEKDNKCQMEITDPARVEILPNFDPIDIRRTLDTDTVRYLWDSFGSVLPLALHDVGKERPKNPIHFLAHKLIHHKYNKTTDEKRQMNNEADKYRADIFQKRKEKAAAASKAWKSRQVKPRKPEESDDAEAWTVYNAQVAEQMFTMSLNFYNN